MIDLPSVSVVIPCYNYSDFVCDAVESCLLQDYPHDRYEIIVVDDCSTDDSWRKLYMRYRNNPLVKILKQKRNKGYSAAKNEGIRKSVGEYIVTLDADDMLCGEDSISRRAAVLAKYSSVGVVHGTQYVIHGPGGYEYWTKRIYKIGTSKSPKVQAQTTMIRRSVHVRYGLYDDDLRSRSDNMMWYRLRDVAKVQFEKLSGAPVAFYRKHDKSMVEYRKRNPLYNRDVTRVLEQKKALLSIEGITKENTIFLKS